MCRAYVYAYIGSELRLPREKKAPRIQEAADGVCTCICICICVYICTDSAYVCMYVYICVYVYIYIYVYGGDFCKFAQISSQTYQIDPKSTPNRPQIDPKLIPNDPN